MYNMCVYLFVMLRTHKDNIIISLLALPCEQTHVYHLFGYTHLAHKHTQSLYSALLIIILYSIKN